MNIREIVEAAIKEDMPYGDVTTDAIFTNQRSKAHIICKQDGILSGMNVAQIVFSYFEDVEITPKCNDGNPISVGDVVCEIEGLTKSILKGERLALNIMQRMSGIATLTNQYVKEISHTDVKLLDTRKTTPNFRVIEKMAVLHGGGTNHRLNLSVMSMIKDNHIDAAGSMKLAVQKVKETYPAVKVEIEVDSFDKFLEALTLPVDIIMLDNMSSSDMKQCVEQNTTKIKLEASGNVNLETVKEIAETGVDYISVGALTHSYESLDLSLKFK